SFGLGTIGHRFCFSVETGFGGSASRAGLASPIFRVRPRSGRTCSAQQSLPNNPRVYELAGLIDRRQGRWADAAHNLQRASELDPRNLPYLITLAATYNLWLHDYEQYAKVMDRILALHPDRKPARIWRAFIEVDKRADTGPWRVSIEKTLADDPASAKDPFLTGHRFTLALLDRDLDTAG